MEQRMESLGTQADREDSLIVAVTNTKGKRFERKARPQTCMGLGGGTMHLNKKYSCYKVAPFPAQLISANMERVQSALQQNYYTQ